jgi:hypothetical protein
MYQEFREHQKPPSKQGKDRISQTESKIKPLVIDSYLRNFAGADQNIFISPRRSNATPKVTDRINMLRKSAGGTALNKNTFTVAKQAT